MKFSADSSHLEATVQPSVVKNIIESQVRDKVPTGIFVLLHFKFMFHEKTNILLTGKKATT